MGPTVTGLPVPMSGLGSATPELLSMYASPNSIHSRRSPIAPSTISAPGFALAIGTSSSPMSLSSRPPRRWKM